MTVDPKETRMDETREPGKPIHARLTHLPSGVFVEGDTEANENVFRLRRDLWRQLARKLDEVAADLREPSC